MKIINFVFALTIMTLPLSSWAQGTGIPGADNIEVENTISDIQLTNDPCPEPRTALSQTPNDLNLIQEDITRFTLCLQRAQLLERLNTLAMENIDTIESSLILDVPEPDLSSLIIPDTPPMPDFANVSDETANAPIPAPVAQDELNWKVKDINGQTSNLSASVVDDDGNVATVRVGDNLPLSEVKVVAITSLGVKVLQSGKNTFLKWSN